jgi:hypothetical protein
VVVSFWTRILMEPGADLSLTQEATHSNGGRVAIISKGCKRCALQTRCRVRTQRQGLVSIWILPQAVGFSRSAVMAGRHVGRQVPSPSQASLMQESEQHGKTLFRH